MFRISPWWITSEPLRIAKIGVYVNETFLSLCVFAYFYVLMFPVQTIYVSVSITNTRRRNTVDERKN